MTTTDNSDLATGTNRGSGHVLVEEALRGGTKRVYAGTRQPLVDPDVRGTVLSQDVTNSAQIQEAVEQVNSEIPGSTP
jgi:NAD(P)-dependent dehydrogenase (short-subunit alcohol dehydrogenase family)